ncbi:cytochrome c oxidase assembly protein, partial [Streptomyces sp. NPDC056728]
MDHSGHGMNMDLPPFTLGRGLEWSADPFFLIGCLVALGLYGWGVVRLARRGDSWQVGRTLSFVVGVLTVMLVMCTKLNDYGMVMFSVHMVQHMVISMLSPILLLMGAPITLALRAMPVARRGAKGPRELLLMFLHSRYMRIITHPAFTIPLF